MYAWDIALLENKIKIITQQPADTVLISQPPHDLSMGHASMCHYTWGSTYKDQKTNKEIWKWDKRLYNSKLFGLQVRVGVKRGNWVRVQG